MSYSRVRRGGPLMALGARTKQTTTFAGLGSLGDAASDEALAREQYRKDSLAELRNISDWQQRWVLKDERQRWIQIAVTAAIPLFGAIYKIVGKALSRGE